MTVPEGCASDGFRAAGEASAGFGTAWSVSAESVSADSESTDSAQPGSVLAGTALENAAKHVGKWHDFAPSDANRGPGIPYKYSNNPYAGQWDGRTLSSGIIADYKRMVMTDGEGIRNSLYVSGCLFRCEKCWNSSIWDFRAGKTYTKELEDSIIADLEPDYIQGLSLMGGEPMLNTPVLLPLLERIRETYGNAKDIWSWTGYTWEELMRDGETGDKARLLSYVDVLVDGRYIEEKKDSLLQFRGSSNQRIIDVKKSLLVGRVEIWEKLKDQKRFIPEISGKERAAGEGAN